MAETDGARLRLREHEGDAERDMAADDEDILRKVASEKIIRDVIDRMGFIPVIQAPHDKARRKWYEASPAMYDEIEWARVVKSVYLRGQGKALSADEAAWGERARRYVHGDIRGAGYTRGAGGGPHSRSRGARPLVNRVAVFRAARLASPTICCYRKNFAPAPLRAARV